MNQILNLDCVEGVRGLETASVPLTVTSPPYDKLRKFEPFDFESLAKELWRVTVDGGVVVWLVGDQIVKGSESGTSFRQALHFKEVGFNLHHTMIYSPLGKFLTNHLVRHGSALQYMFVLSKGKPRTIHLLRDKRNVHAGRLRAPERRRPNRLRWRSSDWIPIRQWGTRGPIWTYAVGSKTTAKEPYVYDHPALMPEDLARDHILSWSNPGELVLDPFCGAGTTPKMAVLLGRKYLGFEIEERWCRLAERRIRDTILSL